MGARIWLPLARLLAVGLALGLVGGCSTLRDVGVPPLPSIRDIDRVEEARAWVARDTQAVEQEIAELCAQPALSSVDEEQLQWDRRKLVELAEEDARLVQTEEQIVQGIASDQVRTRQVFNELDRRLVPLTRRYELLQQRQVASRRQGAEPPARSVTEMAEVRVKMDRLREWQNRIVAASSGAVRATDPGWPVLEGDARRRAAEARQTITGAPVEDLE